MWRQSWNSKIHGTLLFHVVFLPITAKECTKFCDACLPRKARKTIKWIFNYFFRCMDRPLPKPCVLSHVILVLKDAVKRVLKPGILVLYIWRYFDSVDVCKIREGWAEARVNGCFPAFAGPPAKVALVNVFSTTDVDFCLFQEGVRLVFLFVFKRAAWGG